MRVPGAVASVEGTEGQGPGGRVFGVNGESWEGRLDGSLWAMVGGEELWVKSRVYVVNFPALFLI